MARKPAVGLPATLPLFPEPPRVARRARPRLQRAAAWGKCPACRSADRHAVVHSASHLVWREHRYTTHSGAKLICPTSGSALCIAPDRNTPGLTCPCEAR